MPAGSSLRRRPRKLQSRLRRQRAPAKLVLDHAGIVLVHNEMHFDHIVVEELGDSVEIGALCVDRDKYWLPLRGTKLTIIVWSSAS